MSNAIHLLPFPANGFKIKWALEEKQTLFLLFFVAVAFFSGFSDEQESYHEDDLIKLSAVTKKCHMRHSELMMNFR